VRKIGALTCTPTVLGASEVFAAAAALAKQEKASEQDSAEHGEEKVCLM
jgi:hypothetical protein